MSDQKDDKKPEVEVQDLSPNKDAKGGVGSADSRTADSRTADVRAADGAILNAPSADGGTKGLS